MIELTALGERPRGGDGRGLWKFRRGEYDNGLAIRYNAIRCDTTTILTIFPFLLDHYFFLRLSCLARALWSLSICLIRFSTYLLTVHHKHQSVLFIYSLWDDTHLYNFSFPYHSSGYLFIYRNLSFLPTHSILLFILYIILYLIRFFPRWMKEFRQGKLFHWLIDSDLPFFYLCFYIIICWLVSWLVRYLVSWTYWYDSTNTKKLKNLKSHFDKYLHFFSCYSSQSISAGSHESSVSTGIIVKNLKIFKPYASRYRISSIQPGTHLTYSTVCRAIQKGA